MVDFDIDEIEVKIEIDISDLLESQKEELENILKVDKNIIDMDASRDKIYVTFSFRDKDEMEETQEYYENLELKSEEIT